MLTYIGAMSEITLTPKRLEIADAALKIIGTQGISALTTATLAAELGVSVGAPFRHFANREEILEAVAIRVEELILETIPDCECAPIDRRRGRRTSTSGRFRSLFPRPASIQSASTNCATPMPPPW